MERLDQLGNINYLDVKYKMPCSVLVSSLRRGSVADRFLGFPFRIPLAAWMSVSCECCVLSGRGLCHEPIPRAEGSYRIWCVIVCDLETSRMRRPWPALGCLPFSRNQALKLADNQYSTISKNGIKILGCLRIKKKSNKF
jgi:hypothetical protein